ncbi:hypothetical protein [uncultured Dysosmobacter sp.]|uniref:hypothetical protein n=1 Tax=uncultured Dysosmobacter sp. TaxID=2591384 RepID=UPI0026190452|nr:hypothetical protein [uncultured Dysosmobacter sp.]
MKKQWILGGAGLLAAAVLVGCLWLARQPVETAPETGMKKLETVEKIAAEEPRKNMLPGLDTDAVTAAMPEADQAAFTLFLPVLRGEAAFQWVAGPYDGNESTWEPIDATLADFHDQLWDGFAIEDPPETLTLDRLAVQDVDGDGELELVLLFQDGAYQYLILRREGETVYGTSMGVRWFEELQTSGVYIGSGGAGDHTYHRMTFEDGRFADRELARKVEGASGAVYTLDGQETTKEAFDGWYAENMPGGVIWYAPDGTPFQDGM